MKPLFLYDELQHPPLLKAVIGPADHLSNTPAQAPGFVVSAASQGGSIASVAAPDGQMDGNCVSGLTAENIASLDFYHAVLGGTRTDITLSNGVVATLYFSQTVPDAEHGPWFLEGWVEKWGEISVLAAKEIMQYRGEKSVADVGAMLGMIRARAWSRQNARKSLHGSGTLHGQIALHQARRPYAAYFALDEYDLQHERFDGSLSDTVKRAVFLAPDAALVLPYDPQRDRVLLVEQVRMGPLARGDRSLWQLEPIAGRLDPGEDPQAAARREALEEAGLTLGHLEAVAETYCSPGNSSEFYYIYVGVTDLPDHSAGLGGLAAEDEDIRSHLLDFDVLMDMCDAQTVANAPLVMAAYWLAHHRDRLRAEAKETK